MSKELDLSIPNCHICGDLYERNFAKEIEWCINPKCQVFGVKFHIPYITSVKWQPVGRSRKAATVNG